MTVLKLLRGAAQVLFFVIVYEALSLLSTALHLMVPGSILGLILVFILLQAGILKLSWIELGAGWLLAEMLLFFIPPAAGIIQYKSLLAADGLQIMLVIVLTSVLVMASAGMLTQLVGRGGKKAVHDEDADRSRIHPGHRSHLLGQQEALQALEAADPVPVRDYASSAVIVILSAFRIPYESYDTGGRWLAAMVGPATVALAVPMHKNAALLKKHALEISAGVAAGWITGTAGALLICRLFHLDVKLADSLMLRATTTPIALAITKIIGGISTLTAVFVLITGILGTMLGPLMIRWIRIRSEVAQGVLMGSSAHTAGTHKAFELGAVPGSIASIAMILSAFISLLLIPLLAGFAAAG